MTITEWNKYIDALKVNITKIHDNCREEITSVLTESSRFNHAESLTRDYFISEKIAAIVSKANHATIGILYEAINSAESIAKEANNEKLADIIEKLQIMLSKAVNDSVKNESENKKNTANRMLEQRYMWQAYEKNVDQAKLYGLVTAGIIIDEDTSLSVLGDIDDIMNKSPLDENIDEAQLDAYMKLCKGIMAKMPKELTNYNELNEKTDAKKEGLQSNKSSFEKNAKEENLLVNSK